MRTKHAMACLPERRHHSLSPCSYNLRDVSLPLRTPFPHFKSTLAQPLNYLQTSQSVLEPFRTPAANSELWHPITASFAPPPAHTRTAQLLVQVLTLKVSAVSHALPSYPLLHTQVAAIERTAPNQFSKQTRTLPLAQNLHPTTVPWTHAAIQNKALSNQAETAANTQRAYIWVTVVGAVTVAGAGRAQPASARRQTRPQPAALRHASSS